MVLSKEQELRFRSRGWLFNNSLEDALRNFPVIQQGDMYTGLNTVVDIGGFGFRAENLLRGDKIKRVITLNVRPEDIFSKSGDTLCVILPTSFNHSFVFSDAACDLAACEPDSLPISVEVTCINTDMETDYQPEPGDSVKDWLSQWYAELPHQKEWWDDNEYKVQEFIMIALAIRAMVVGGTVDILEKKSLLCQFQRWLEGYPREITSYLVVCSDTELYSRTIFPTYVRSIVKEPHANRLIIQKH